MLDSQNKNTLRQEARRHRARFDLRSEDPEAAIRFFFENVKLKKKDVIAGYWASGMEFSPLGILEELLMQKFTCCLPVVDKNSRVLKFAPWDEKTPLKKAAYDIMEPETDADTEWQTPNIVIVPMLAFDRRGYRLGQGGGYYDATLRDLRSRKKILAVGTAWAQQACLFNLPVEDHDEKLDLIITPLGIHDFRA